MITTVLKVRLYGDPCLRKKSIPVKEVGSVERMLIQSMIATMHHHKGIGLAAPQIGINQRILVADVGTGPMAIINPKIVKRSGTADLEEGCLSIPDITIPVRRAEKILVQYIDEHGRPQQREFQDLLARVVMHETDHLNGKLIIDYANFIQQRKIRPILLKLEKLSKEI
jgi:peptide deformylase